MGRLAVEGGAMVAEGSPDGLADLTPLIAERRRFAVALVEREDAVLMVRRSDVGEGGWTVPFYESEGRSFPDLASHLGGETGLGEVDFRAMRYFVQVLATAEEPETMWFAIALSAEGALPAAGTLSVGEAVGEGDGARFVGRLEAATLMREHPLAELREPALAYLAGAADAEEAAWAYRRSAAGGVELIVHLSGAAGLG